MESDSNFPKLLSMMGHPAFCVSGGIITAANEAALGRLISVGSEIQPLLATGRAEYAAFTEGRLCLSLAVSGTIWDATVQIVDGVHIFSLEPEHSDAQLQTLALAAQQLRTPLSSIKTMMDQLLPQLEGAAQTSSQQLAYLYRSLNQMQRIIYNMSDTGRYTSTPPKMAVQEVGALLEELIERCTHLCEHAGIQLRYTKPQNRIYSLIDTERLERCVYNILSNSMKHTQPGGSIHVQLSQSGNLLLLTVQDTGEGLDLEQAGDLYARYLREPSIETHGNGLGLGMALIRACARAHGGTVLLSSAKGGGMRLTMSLRIRLETTLASPTVRFDYAGDQDHALIELSDALPPELYAPHKN